MLKIFRKWSIALKRRRLKKERAKLERYVAAEANAVSGELRCHNCRAPLTGPFCHVCGQRDDDLRRPIWTFFRELLDAIFDTDSKIIKTIMLLVLVPGGLSRAFMEGKRARFLPPFRLYVVLLFVFFSTLSLADVLILDVHVQPKEETVQARVEADKIRAQVEQDIAAAEEAREKALQSVRESTKQIEEQLVRDGLIEPGEITKRLEEAGVTVPDLSALENLQSLERLEQFGDEAVPGPPASPGSLEASIGKIGTEDQSVALFEGLVEAFERETLQEEAVEKTEQLSRAQAKVRDMLSTQAAELSEEELDAIEDLLMLSPRDIALAADAGEKNRNFNFDFDALPYRFDVAMFAPNDNLERDGIKQEDLDFILNDDGVPPIVKKATAGLAEALKSPREFNKLFNDYLPWSMVILLPVFAFILRLTHWGKRRYYLNQLVFALHFHSFLLVLLTAFAFIVPVVGGQDAFDIFWIVVSIYIIIALKVGQDQGWIRAFLKAGFIWVSYFIIMMATMFMVMFIGISDSSVSELVDTIQQADAGAYDSLDEPPTRIPPVQETDEVPPSN